jgi:hypothetical protein
VTCRPEAFGRSSSWPYGSANGPLTSTIAPRAGAGMPSGKRTAMPAVPSAIANTRGVPSRPASAVTTPATRRTVPIGAPRASAMSRVGGGVGPGVGAVDGPGDGVGAMVGDGRGVGLGVAAGVGAGTGDGVMVGIGTGVTVGDGLRLGVGTGVGEGVGERVGVGVGDGSTSCRSPGSVACTR